ncbi:MAG: CAP domain-containing protein [Marinosulfonomonas sp.]
MNLRRAVLTKRSIAVAAACLAAFLALAPTNAAPTCPAPSNNTAAQTPIGKTVLDQQLFNNAVLKNVNFRRCQHGLPPVRSDPGLVSVAKDHAEWMARQRNLSHLSTVNGRTNVAMRIKAVVNHPKAGSENIGYVHRYKVDEIDHFFARAQSCSFVTQAGRTIGQHSYASLAQRIVSLWMQSPPHRVNLLAENVSIFGNAVALDASGPYCGVYYIAQNFAG